jgi:hypothetical protein
MANHDPPRHGAGEEKLQLATDRGLEKEMSSKEFDLKSPMSMDSEAMKEGIIAPVYALGEDGERYNAPPETATDLITEVLHAQDDPSLNPWTFRTWFLGKPAREQSNQCNH